ncbi:MAG TPA: hypothetical protein VEZ24_20340 [Microvirga sp.]|nr:hypothetical protein [Microvirga sp.]
MDDEAFEKKMLDIFDRLAEREKEAPGAQDRIGFTKQASNLIFGMIAATGKALHEDFRAEHRKTDQRLTAIEEHLTAIREGRE